MLTLSMAGIIEEMFPHWTIVFLGNDYTPEIVALSDRVDEFIIKILKPISCK